MKTWITIGLSGWFVALVLVPRAAMAGARGALVREAAACIMRKFGKEAGKGGTEILARKLDKLVARHGIDAVEAARRVGPSAVMLIEEAGEHSAVAAHLLARRSEQAVALVTSRKSMALVARHGDLAAEALLKHPGVATPVIEALGEPGVRAFNALNKREGRRLAQLLEEGWFSQTGRVADVLAVVERFGDRALDFLWRHKGALAVASVLAAFLTDPEAFLNGARQLGQRAGEKAQETLVGSLGEISSNAADVAVQRAYWTRWAFVGLIGIVTYRLVRARIPHFCASRQSSVSHPM
jgi:hypothetical protein